MDLRSKTFIAKCAADLDSLVKQFFSDLRKNNHMFRIIAVNFFVGVETFCKTYDYEIK